MPWSWFALVDEDGGEGQIEARTAEEAAHKWVAPQVKRETVVHIVWAGRWDRRRPRATAVLEQIRVVVDPEEPPCEGGEDHEWDKNECKCGIKRRYDDGAIDQQGRRYYSVRYFR